MIEGTELTVSRASHAHHQIAAAIFVGSLIIGIALILAAELMKPERYEFHPSSSPASYIIYDRDTGRAANVEFSSKDPVSALAK